jgi:fimbrial chaperone protein
LTNDQPATIGAWVRRCLVFLALATVETALGASFSVSPVRVELSPRDNVVAVTVTNTGDQSGSIRLSVFSWRQEANEDRLDPTRELVATPPLFSMAPGESQIVRFGLRRVPTTERELAYRAIFEEIPGPRPAQGAPALQITLRISIPVFYQPRDNLAAMLVWTLARDGADKLRLSVRNDGTASAQLGDLALARMGAVEPFVQKKNFAYVLPGAARSWSLSVPAAKVTSSQVRILTTVDGKRGEVEVAVE